MTDKQIIIDGVDVRECACIIEDYYYQQANNLTNGYKHIKNVCELGESGSEHYNLFCKDNPSCYFKQLKRKEKACKEWKEEYRAKVEELNELEEKLLRKEQECEELKTIIQRHDNDNNALLKEVEDKLCEYYRRYKECLTEIKEIAEEQIPYLNTDKAKTIIEVEYDYAGKIYNLEQRMYKILQKISECKGEYNEKIR